MKRYFLCMEQELIIVDDHQGDYQIQYHLQGLQPICIAMDPFYPKRIYCGTFGRGLWISDDGGDSWKPAGEMGYYYQRVTENTFRSAAITAITVSSVRPKGKYSQVWIGTEPSAVFTSLDGGETWEEYEQIQHLPSKERWTFPPRPHTHHVKVIAENVNNPDHLMVAIEAGATLRSLDRGHEWLDTGPEHPFDAHVIYTHPYDPNRLYVACGDGTFRPGRGFLVSEDNGETWQADHEGLVHQYVYGLVVSPNEPETILVSAAGAPDQAHFPGRACSYLYRKQGNGIWKKVKKGLPSAKGTIISTLATDRTEPNAFYALNNRGLYYSQDRGESWKRLRITWKDTYRHQHPYALLVVAK